MVCEKCRQNMNWCVEGSTQVWRCPACGWNIVTSYIDDIDHDDTVYSLYISCSSEVDKRIIKLVSKIANVNFVTAKQMLKEKKICILRAKAPKIKDAIEDLQELGICYNVSPSFDYIC